LVGFREFPSTFDLRTSSAAPVAFLVSLALVAALAGCAVGPDYKRPAVNAPAAYRTAESDTNAPAGAKSFADLGWQSIYDDPQLKAYIAEALTNSWDVKIAAARVMQAEAVTRVARSQFFPTVNAGGDLVTSRTSERGPFAVSDPESKYGDAFVGMSSYELDLWGRIRRANEAARARLLATGRGGDGGPDRLGARASLAQARPGAARLVRGPLARGAHRAGR